MSGSNRPSFASARELAAFVGGDLGTTAWLALDRDRVASFRAVIDVFGAASASESDRLVPPWLLLSAVSPLVKDVYEVAGVRMRINYGAESIRFDHPVSVGTRVRAHVSVRDATAVPAGHRVTMRLLFEAEGRVEPVGHADVVIVMATA